MIAVITHFPHRSTPRITPRTMIRALQSIARRRRLRAALRWAYTYVLFLLTVALFTACLFMATLAALGAFRP